MVYRDYLKKQIDQLGQVLGKLLADLIGLKMQGQTEQGIENVNQTFKNLLDININEILSLTEEELIKKLEEKTSSDIFLIGLFADIIYEIADSYDLKSEKERKNCLFKKVLALYEHLEKRSSTFSFDNHNKMDIIKNILQQQA